jgi:hypothetical protein
MARRALAKPSGLLVRVRRHHGHHFMPRDKRVESILPKILCGPADTGARFLAAHGYGPSGESALAAWDKWAAKR